MDKVAPTLIEPHAKNYLYESLKTCHHIRVNMYSYILNVGILILFIAVFGLAIYYSSKNKLTDYEKEQKMYRDQQYVLSKIKYYSDVTRENEHSSLSSITRLPIVGNYPTF
uniref:Uncharacterized protein n=1 Tax=viral metagenome TaxID=1070528 RepID=A0A6C0DR82_9ZZZZ